MIIIRQKAFGLFATQEEKKEKKEKWNGMSTGAKIATGVGATALTAGLAFHGAQKGAFGGRAQKWAGTKWAQLGGRFGNANMVKNGFEDAVQGHIAANNITVTPQNVNQLRMDVGKDINFTRNGQKMNMADIKISGGEHDGKTLGQIWKEDHFKANDNSVPFNQFPIDAPAAPQNPVAQ